MMNSKVNKLFYTLSFLLIFSSCYTKKVYNELQGKYDQEVKDNKQKTTELHKKDVAIAELSFTSDEDKKKLTQLAKDTTRLYWKNRNLSLENESSKKRIAQYRAQIKEIQTGTNSQIDQYLNQFERLNKTLEKRERDIRLEKLKVEQKDGEVVQMQQLIEQQKNIQSNIKIQLADALLGYIDNGITIMNREGRVYVSFEEQLLFNVGEYDIDTKGSDAIKKLAKVLAQNKNVQVIVEGHTDDLTMKKDSQFKDNWDLSVLRATSVAREILKDKDIDPKRITAAGRSKYYPIDHSQTPEARQKNRRTEIILAPNMQKLFEIIEGR
ncbi:OmpA family protein [Halosquirtibacter xylanolyticus]|uniref:OmpA/MotB family protein n=1 Tax=Halosquirtibacter xylanolyticus TaxID=3374599 RepID=UPI003749AAEE|nr:OmpA family protein [Prolixibacteraceae bacterium]